MDKCQQCIVRKFSSLRSLNEEELLNISDCKTSQHIKKRRIAVRKVILFKAFFVLNPEFVNSQNYHQTEKAKQ